MRAGTRSRRWGTLVGLTLAAGPLLGLPAAAAGPVGERPVAGSWGPYRSCGASHPRDNCATVYAIASIGSRTYIAGNFTALVDPSTGRKKSVHNLAALSRTGRPVSMRTHRFDGAIRALATDGTRLFAGGAFRHVDGRSASGLAAFSPGGSRVRYPAAGGTVRALTVYHGSLYVGTNRVRKLSARSGKVDRHFTPPRLSAASRAQVWSLAAAGTRLYIGGHFTGPRLALLAVNRGSGALIPGFTPAISTSSASDPLLGISSIALSGGAVYAGQEGHTNRAYRFNSSGSMVWGVVPNGDVQGVAVSNGTVYLAGHFICVTNCGISGEIRRNHIAAMSTGGSVLGWSPGMGSSAAPYYYGVYTVKAIGGAVWTGGVFNSVVSHGKTYKARKIAIFR